MGAVGRLLALLAIVVFLMAGVSAVQSGYQDSALSSQQLVEKQESFTVDEGNLTTLDDSNRNDLVYQPEREINVSESGQVIEPPGNWSWNQHNGTLRVSSNSALTQGATANITYGYARPTEAQNATKELALIPSSTLGEEWPFIAGIILLLMAAGVMLNQKQ